MSKIIALFPGGFKPPHIGHFLSVKYLENYPEINEIRVIISPQERTDKTGKIIITAEQSLAIWNIYLRGSDKIRATISTSPSPVKEVYDLMSTMSPGDVLLLGKGEKETEQDTRFKRAEEWSKKNNLGITVKPIATKIPENLKNISASFLRELIAHKKIDEFMTFLPKHLSNKDKQQVWGILTNMKENKVELEAKRKYNPTLVLQQAYQLVNQQRPLPQEEFDNAQIPNSVFGHVKPLFLAMQQALSPEEIAQKVLQSLNMTIKEISAMGNGDITGAPTPHKDIPNKTGYPYDREKLFQEVKFREAIRQMIKEAYAKKLFSYQESLLQETFLRSKIKNLLLQEKKSKAPETFHPSTGINVLEDLLKQIIPTIEQDYKVLTTSEEQRDSFKNHILNAINKTITTLDINQSAGEENTPGLDEGLIPEIDVAVGQEVDAKYIDIDKKPGDEEEEDTFTIAGQDTTGRNMAQQTYDKIEKNIIDSYSMLDDPEDQKVFYDYLMTNTKLYFEKFEDELSAQVQEPMANAEPEGADLGGDNSADGQDLNSLL